MLEWANAWFRKHAAPSHAVAPAEDDPLSAVQNAHHVFSISLPPQATVQFPLFRWFRCPPLSVTLSPPE